MRYLTAGESHGKSLTGLLDGFPSGVEIKKELVNQQLSRRQQGYGRGDRMKIEKDQAEFLSGIRNGKTLGSPITISIENKDWANWINIMSSDTKSCEEGAKVVTTPRPGHADLAGGIKYRHRDLRNVLERASARETAVRVAVGAVCRQFLSIFDISIFSQVLEIGSITVSEQYVGLCKKKEFAAAIELSQLRTCDKSTEELMMKLIDRAKLDGESLGGIFEVIATNIPIGLGSHTQWDKKLDARIAMAIMSIQAIKGVEIGLGFAASRLPGSMVHDEIGYQENGFTRKTNNAGGIEGGMSNGSDIVVKAAMKPIATLYNPLNTIDIASKESKTASVERSDNCAVPAASVIGEAVLAIELTSIMLEKFGCDNIDEIKTNFDAYKQYCKSY